MIDLISRRGMCDSLDKYRIAKMLEGKDVSLVWECIDKVLQEPSVQPERKTGKWIDDNCSVCGQYVHHGDARNYCPNCGAKMRGDKNDG